MTQIDDWALRFSQSVRPGLDLTERKWSEIFSQQSRGTRSRAADRTCSLQQQNLKLIQLKSVISVQSGPSSVGLKFFKMRKTGSWRNLWSVCLSAAPAATICRNFNSGGPDRTCSDYLFLFSSQIKIFLVFSLLIAGKLRPESTSQDPR